VYGTAGVATGLKSGASDSNGGTIFSGLSDTVSL